MIKSVIVTNYLGDSLELELASPEKSGFAIGSITGLGPGKADINTTEISSSDGAIFNSSRLNKRNIVIVLVFHQAQRFVGGKMQPLESIETIRQRSYKYFPIKKKVTLQIKTENRCAQIEGYIESNEPTIFSKTQGSVISIICPNPYFYSSGENSITTTIFNSILPGLEFPISNEVTVEQPNLKTLEFGTINSSLTKLITYKGDAEIGVTISITATDEVGDIDIYNTLTRERMVIDNACLAARTGSGVKAGDNIIICTVKGKKSVTLIRDGVKTNILCCLTKESNWFQLQEGDNIFTYTTGIPDTTNYIQLTIENQTIFEGM